MFFGLPNLCLRDHACFLNVCVCFCAMYAHTMRVCIRVRVCICGHSWSLCIISSTMACVRQLWLVLYMIRIIWVYTVVFRQELPNAHNIHTSFFYWYLLAVHVCRWLTLRSFSLITNASAICNSIFISWLEKIFIFHKLFHLYVYLYYELHCYDFWSIHFERAVASFVSQW